MTLQQRELEDAERFRGLDPVLERFRQERPIKIQRKNEQQRDRVKYEHHFRYIEMVWMSKNNKLSFIQIQDPSGLDVNFTKVGLPDSQEKILKWHSIPEIKKQYERDMKREFGDEEKAPNEIDWQTLEMNAI